MKSYDIVAYTYNADLYCPECVVKEVAKDYPAAAKEIGEFADYDGILYDAEDYLTDISKVCFRYEEEVGGRSKFDRMDEYSFDSSEFPKVVFCDQIESDFDICGGCLQSILD